MRIWNLLQFNQKELALLVITPVCMGCDQSADEATAEV